MQPQRPNVLFAIADDASWRGAFDCRPGVLRTPAMDRVGSEGVRFTNSYCGSPSCTPSRSVVLTGRQMWQVQEAGVLYGQMPPQHAVFTHLLEDAGYLVGNTGKTWAPGDWGAGGQKRPPSGRDFNKRLLEPPSKGLDKRDYTANFADFLATRKAGQPFFFWYGGTEPHRVYGTGYGQQLGKRLEDVDVPPFWQDTETVRRDLLDYCAEVEWFDSHLGKMMALIEKVGELDNTLVVVTSDNGMPFPRAKVNLYDWGIRMPLAMRWGRRWSGGLVEESFVHHMDLAPTILEAAQVRVPATMTGKSLLKLDTGRDAIVSGLERHVMARAGGATYPVRALRTKDFLYLRNFEPGRWPTGGSFISSNRTPHGDVDECPTAEELVGRRGEFPKQYALGYAKRPAEELYDLKQDRWQMTNVAKAAAYQATRMQLRGRLEAYLKQTGDPRVEGRDPWQGYVYHQTNGFGASFNRSLPEAQREAARRLPRHKPE